MSSEIKEGMSIFPGISEVPEARLEVVVGRLLCHNMRDMLESEVFSGRPIRWREGKGWLEHSFTIVGPIEYVRQIKQRIDFWAAALGESDKCRE